MGNTTESRRMIPELVGVLGVLWLLFVAMASVIAGVSFTIIVALELLSGDPFAAAIQQGWDLAKVLWLGVLGLWALAIPIWGAWYGLNWAWTNATGEKGKAAEGRLMSFLLSAGLVLGAIAFAVWFIWGLAFGGSSERVDEETKEMLESVVQHHLEAALPNMMRGSVVVDSVAGGPTFYTVRFHVRSGSLPERDYLIDIQDVDSDGSYVVVEGYGSGLEETVADGLARQFMLVEGGRITPLLASLYVLKNVEQNWRSDYIQRKIADSGGTSVDAFESAVTDTTRIPLDTLRARLQFLTPPIPENVEWGLDERGDRWARLAPDTSVVCADAISFFNIDTGGLGSFWWHDDPPACRSAAGVWSLNEQQHIAMGAIGDGITRLLLGNKSDP